MATTIAIAGKGGTGKTVVAAMIIKYLKENTTGPVLALDADPDSNLGTVLGIRPEKTLGDLREETLLEMKKLPPGMSKSNYVEAGLHQIITETDKVDLITMGRSEGPGCYCYINNLLRKFADELQVSYNWVVMDNEAGLEHLSRRTASSVDHLITVINENPLSIDCAKRIEKLISDLKNPVRNRHLLINNVSSEGKLALLRKRTEHLSFDYLGHIFHDKVLDDAIFNGKPLLELDGCAAMSEIAEIMTTLIADSTHQPSTINH